MVVLHILHIRTEALVCKAVAEGNEVPVCKAAA